MFHSFSFMSDNIAQEEATLYAADIFWFAGVHRVPQRLREVLTRRDDEIGVNDLAAKCAEGFNTIICPMWVYVEVQVWRAAQRLACMDVVLTSCRGKKYITDNRLKSAASATGLPSQRNARLLCCATPNSLNLVVFHVSKMVDSAGTSLLISQLYIEASCLNLQRIGKSFGQVEQMRYGILICAATIAIRIVMNFLLLKSLVHCARDS